MAYIHKETFEVVEKLSQPKDNCLIIDDAIVPSIQILNRKGYITTECCAGHPVSGTENRKRQSYIGFKKGVVLPSLPTGFTVMRRYIMINGRNIEIDDNRRNQPTVRSKELETMLVEKPELQKEISVIIGCNWKLNVDFYVFLRENANSLEQLYKWALDLPDFKNEI